MDFQNLKLNGVHVTEKESLVISCLMNGKRTKSIALILGVSPHTVISHLRNIMTKLGVSSQDQIILCAERSEFYAYLKNLYLKTKFQNDFKMALKEIRKIILNHKIDGKIYVSLQNVEFGDIRQNLNLAGVLSDLVRVEETSTKGLHYFFHVNDRENGHIYEVDGEKIADYYIAVLALIEKICKIPEVSSIYKKFQHSVKDLSEEKTEAGRKENKNSKKLLVWICTGFAVLVSLLLCFLYSEDSQLISNINTTYREHYVPRNFLINKIRQILKKQPGVKLIALNGEGGIGKTVLANMYAVEQDFKLVWRINAETEYSIKKELVSIATSLAVHGSKSLRDEMMYIRSIPDKAESFNQTLMFVFRKLKDIGNWCIIFDNVDDFRMVRKYLPTSSKISGNGTIIVTTRNSNAGLLLRCAQLPVEYLKSDEKLKLFSKVCGKEFKNPVGQKIVKVILDKLSPIPLDITISAGYLSGAKVDPSVVHTLRFFDISGNTGYIPLDYHQTRYELVAKILDKLLSENVDFEELLLLLCVVNSQDIPKRLLLDVKNEDVVNEFMLTLQRYSLITSEKGMISIHKSLQDVIRKYVLANLKNLNEKFCHIANVLANPEFIRVKANHDEISVLLPHINEAIRIAVDLDLESKIEIVTKLNVGKFFVLFDVDSSANVNKFAKENILPYLGEGYIDLKDVVLLLNDIAYGYMRIGEFRKAKKVLNRCFKIYAQFAGESFLASKAVSQAYLINVNSGLGESKYSITDFKIILEQLDSLNDLKYNTAKAIVCYQCYSFCINNGLSAEDLEDFLKLMGKFLKTVGDDEFYGKNVVTQQNSLPFFIPGVRYRMAGIFNILGKYDNALENIKKVQFFYDKRKKSGNLSMALQSDLDLEYANTLFGLGHFRDAYRVLRRVIQIKSRINDEHNMFRAFICLMETCIQLKEYGEAKILAIEATKHIDKKVCFQSKLLYLKYLYAKFIINQKTNDEAVAKSYKEFRNFLEKFSDMYGSDTTFIQEYQIKN